MPIPHGICCCSLAAADIPPAQHADSDAIDGGHDADREMDSDEERDFADQGPLTDMDMEEDAQILATLLKHILIPRRFKDDQRRGSASADTQRDRGNGSRLYEVNIWMWRYG